MPAPSPSSHETAHTSAEYRLAVSNYDRTASLLIALLVIVGLSVAGLLIVFAARRFRSVAVSIPVVPVEASTSAQAALGLKRDLEPPGVQQSEQLTEPSLEDTLTALSAVASERQVLLDDEDVDSADESSRGEGYGDRRQHGDDVEGVVERVPRWVRWRLRFQPGTIELYAVWLDYYQIELAVLGSDNLIHYAADLSREQPRTRQAKPGNENRGYTNALDGPFVAYHLQLANRAGIAERDRPILLFYPFEVEAILYDLERRAAQGRSANDIRRTIFTVLESGGDFEFKVIDQQFF